MSEQNKELVRRFYEEVEKSPGVKQRIAGATRVAPFRAAKEYSYRSRTSPPKEAYQWPC